PTLGSVLCCFFFQAEDGIRDLTVTGVQTCALPISVRRYLESSVSEAALQDHFRFILECVGHDAVISRVNRAAFALDLEFPFQREIGRASCRERGLSGGGAMALEDEVESRAL